MSETMDWRSSLARAIECSKRARKLISVGQYENASKEIYSAKFHLRRSQIRMETRNV